MKLVPGETSLVVAGAWNPAIVTPEWVLTNGLGEAMAPGLQIQAFLPAVQGLAFEFPRFALAKLSFSVRPDALILAPVQADDDLAVIEEAAARMVEQLRHTPIRGVGHNFEFREPDPDPKVLDVFTSSRQDLADEMPDGWIPSAASLIATFSNEERNVMANVHRHFEAGRVTVKFNFHHPVTTTDQAVSVLRGQGVNVRMMQNLELAKQLMEKLYGEPKDD